MKEYIEKEAALDAVCYYCCFEPSSCDGCADYNCIDVLLPADVKPVVRGEWIPDEYYPEYKFWCSACKWTGEHPYNFCPNCGAEMRGEVK